MTPEKRAAKKSWRKARGRWYRRWTENGKRHTTTNSRWIWELENGPVPKGKLIHHIDFDKANDSPENLQCVTSSEHKILRRKHPHIWIDGIEHRHCTVCGYQPLSEFGRLRNSYRPHCRKCDSAASTKWRRDNRERYNANQRARYARKKAAKTT